MKKPKDLWQCQKKNSTNGWQKTESFDCPKCKDRELVYNKELDAVEFCECREKKQYERILNASGISEAFRQKTFANFNDRGIYDLRQAKTSAFMYVKEFENIKGDSANSIAFLGQVGSGKTHLSLAIANILMANNVGVLYMQYREVITALKQNIIDEYYYQKELSKYKNASVLLIDDLFKGKVNESDINIMFEIINHRYLKRAPIIISSEFTVNKLLDFDEAIGSRLIEMCGSRTIEFTGEKLNHRLYKYAM